MLKAFLRTLILMTQVFFLPVFPSRTNLKLHNISVTPKLVKSVITILDSSNASGPDYIPVGVLKNCEPEIPYRLAASSTLQYVFEGISFSRLLEGLISGPCI